MMFSKLIALTADSILDGIAELARAGQSVLARLYTWTGPEFGGSFRPVGPSKRFPMPAEFQVFRRIKFHDFSGFSRSNVTVDSSFVINVLMACYLIAQSPETYLDYYYLNDPQMDGRKVTLPDGSVEIRQSTPPKNFFKVSADEMLIIQKTNDGQDIEFIRQQEEDDFSQIFFVFKMSQLDGIRITQDDLVRRIGGLLSIDLSGLKGLEP